MTDILSTFEQSKALLDRLVPMMDNSGIGNDNDAWPNNILSRHLVIYADGKISTRDKPVRHAVDPRELDLCRRLSTQAAELARDCYIPSEAQAALAPFYVTANTGSTALHPITANFVNDIFNSTLFPGTLISVEPLQRGTGWWYEVIEEEALAHQIAHADRWRRLISWFAQTFQTPVFVKIGDDRSMQVLDSSRFPPGTVMTGSVFPRLLAGQSDSGSLIGLISYAVMT